MLRPQFRLQFCIQYGKNQISTGVQDEIYILKLIQNLLVLKTYKSVNLYFSFCGFKSFVNSSHVSGFSELIIKSNLSSSANFNLRFNLSLCCKRKSILSM